MAFGCIINYYELIKYRKAMKCLSTNLSIDGELECEQFKDDADIGWDDFTVYLVVDAAGAVSIVYAQWSDVTTFRQVVGSIDCMTPRPVHL